MSQRRLVAWSLALILLAAPAHGQRSGTVSGGGGTGRASSSVVATWEAHGAEPGGPPLLNTLDLLVLWRGRPGWSDGLTESGVGGSEHVHRLKAGDTTLELRFDPKARAVRINGQMIELSGDNVVLVDDVDSGNGPRVVGTLRIDVTMRSLDPDPVPAVGAAIATASRVRQVTVAAGL